MCQKNRVSRSSPLVMLLLFGLLSPSLYAQSEDRTIRLLTESGFENISRAEDAEEIIYALECTPYRISAMGVSRAIEIIRNTGLSPFKTSKIIILDNNIPRLMLTCEPALSDSLSVADPERSDWQASVELGDSWNKIRREKRQNSSLYKVDILVYPELHFRNYNLSRVYSIVVNVSPVVEISLWKGMKLATQIIFPIKNDYGPRYQQIRPGFVTLSQTVRLPFRTFWTTSFGTFNNSRWGVDTQLRHILKDERFAIEARLGYTGYGIYDNWAYYHGTQYALTGSLGASAYWPKYNTLFRFSGERYLQKDYGVRGEMMRHFRYTSIGFYATKTWPNKRDRDNGATVGNKGINGGFIFQIAIPPYRQKRRGHWPRVNAGDFSLGYNAGNEEIYGKTYRPRHDDNQLRNNQFNPYFIKSEIINLNSK